LATISFDRTLDERSRDRLTPSTPGGKVHQHVLIALKVTEKFADVSLKTVDAGEVGPRLCPNRSAVPA
jgi:hypothetical protein